MSKHDPKTGRDAHRYSGKTAPRDTRPTPSWAGRESERAAPKGGWDGDRDRDHAKDARAKWM